MKTINAFDFDGTLTRRDSLIEFIRVTRGNLSLLYTLLLFSPLIALMKLHLLDNGWVKQLLFRYFFHRVSVLYFADICAHFAEQKKDLLRPEGVKAVSDAVSRGEEVLIVSASVDQWVEPFFNNLGFTTRGDHPQVRIVGTQLETKGDLITGRFLTPNCYGPEKVRRIRELFPDRSSYRLVAYGDSRGDRELLADADEAHYKPFK